MTDNAIYPWLQDNWQRLIQRYQRDQLPHALLLSGPVGLGKQYFAEQLARTLMCDRNHTMAAGAEMVPPCGECNGCHLMKAGTHPDYRVVQPESEGKQIPIDSIREVSQFLNLKSQFAPMQVIIVTPAEAMNRYAANSLLKTLEEPTPGSLLLLISSQMSHLLPTIRSRCQVVNFTAPATAQARQWLDSQLDESMASLSGEDKERLLVLAQGSPLTALKFAQTGMLEQYQRLLQSFEKIAKKQVDPVAEAKQWEAVGLSQAVTWLYGWVAALIRFKSDPGTVDSTGVGTGESTMQWREPALASLQHQLQLQQLYRYLDKVVATVRIKDTTVNVQLALEDLLISWQQLHAGYANPQ